MHPARWDHTFLLFSSIPTISSDGSLGAWTTLLMLSRLEISTQLKFKSACCSGGTVKASVDCPNSILIHSVFFLPNRCGKNTRAVCFLIPGGALIAAWMACRKAAWQAVGSNGWLVWRLLERYNASDSSELLGLKKSELLDLLPTLAYISQIRKKRAWDKWARNGVDKGDTKKNVLQTKAL